MGRTVLVVDDDRHIVDLLAELFTEEGYHVRCAFDGQMALEALDRGPTDVVVADVMMPRLDGLTLARRLRERASPIPVVLISAVVGDVDLPNVRFVRKPFDLDHLVAIVRRTLGAGAG